MKNLKIIILPLLLVSCASGYRADRHEFPSPVDTSSREIHYQQKKEYTIGDVTATNDFPSGRLNDFFQVSDSTYHATIRAENTPINSSTWFAFKIWSATDKTVYVQLRYSEYKHRYKPKLSSDGEHWTLMDSTLINVSQDSIQVTMKLDISPDTLWVAAQEIQDHRRVGDWAGQVSDKDFITLGHAGNSVLGRSLYFMDISKGKSEHKPAIVVLSRQHPPEVSGYKAMQAFVETVIEEGNQNGFLDDFRVMVYPMINPDGVDLGHYRHNTGGIDLNRDWALYNQPEVKQVVDHIVKNTRKDKNQVVFGIDFHSTQYDVFYTRDRSIQSNIPGFIDEWLSRIQKELDIEDINDQPGRIGRPTSSGWFYKQFGAEAVTYEVGDETPRDFIRLKGEAAAKAMMDILMENLHEWNLKK